MAARSLLACPSPALFLLGFAFLSTLSRPGERSIAFALTRTRAIRVKDLSDANFEHDTQAGSGQTTGRWLVIFTGPEPEPEETVELGSMSDGSSSSSTSDGEAGSSSSSDENSEGGGSFGVAGATPTMRLIHSVMQVASEQVPREFIPATVKVEESPVLRKRFRISSTPCVKLFRDQKVYTYPGVPDSAAALREFLETGYAGVPAEPVPPAPSAWSGAWEALQQQYKDVAQNLKRNPLHMAGVGVGVAMIFYALTASMLGLGKKPRRKGKLAAEKKKQ